MSNEVDNKVVTMTFNNAEFAKRMEDTIKGLQRLRDSLKLTEGAKGIKDVASAMDKVNADKPVSALTKVKDAIKNIGKSKGDMDLSKSTKFDGAAPVAALGQVKTAIHGIGEAKTDMDMTPVGTSVEGLSAKFVAMSAVAFSVISGITTRIGGMAASFANGFTLGPVTDGFHEFETNMGAIQTILANTDRYGTTLPQVTASLDELNTYSDKTIYNFGEMVKNIGLFTNAGIRIEDATSMIKGFSNAAAASGVTAEGAAGAAYQLSQALSNGTVRLMDWKSLTNVGLGSSNMKDGIIKIAGAMGTLEKTGVKANDASAHFNETLEKGWLSADVMSNYLKIMSGDMTAVQMSAMGLSDDQVVWFQKQEKTAEDAATKVRTFSQLLGTVKEAIGSGWSETFRNVFGDFKEGTKLFTDINNSVSGVVSNMAAARNGMLAGWKAFGGRDTLIKGLSSAMEALGNIFKTVQFAFRSMFPRTTSLGLINLTNSFAKFAAKLVITGDTVKNLFRILRAFFSVLKLGWTIVKGVASVFGALFKALMGGGESLGIMRFLANIADFITFLSGNLGTTAVNGFFGGLVKGIGAAGSIFQTVGRFIAGFFTTLVPSIVNGGKAIVGFFAGGFGKATSAVKDFFSGFTKGTDELGSAQTKFAQWGAVIHLRLAEVKTAIKDFWSGFTKGTDELGNAQSKFAQWGAVVYLRLSQAVAVAKAFGKTIVDAFHHAVDVVKEFVKTLTTGLTGWKKSPVETMALKMRAALVIIQAVGMLIAGVFVNLFHTITGVSISFGGIIDSIGGFFADLFDGIKNGTITLSGIVSGLADTIGGFFDKIFGGGSGGGKKSDPMDPGGNVGGMIYGLKNLATTSDKTSASIDKGISAWDRFKARLKTMADFVYQVADDIGDGIHDMFDGIKGIFAGQSLDDLFNKGVVVALFKMAFDISGFFKNFMDLSGINKAMDSLSGVFDEAGDTLKAFQKKLKADAIKSIAVAIGILALSMIALSFIPGEKLLKATAAMSGATAQIIAIMVALDKTDISGPKMLAMGTALVSMAWGMVILAGAVKLFGSMDLPTLGKGLGGISVALLGFTLMFKFMGAQNENIAKAGLTIIAMSIALNFMTRAVKNMGEIPWQVMLRGLGGLALALVILVAAMRGMADSDMERGGLGMLLLSYSLKNMANAVALFGKMKLSALVTGLLALDVALTSIVMAMDALPENMISKSLGMGIVALSLLAIAKAVQMFGKMKLSALGTGLLAIGAAIGIVVLAANAMEGGMLGAVAMVVMAYALGKLVDVIKEMANLSWAQIGSGLLGIALALVVIGGVSAILGTVSPLIAAFGLSLVLVGVGMLAFGLGAKLVAEAIDMLMKTGKKGIPILIDAIKEMLKALPEFLAVLGKAILKAIADFINGSTPIIEAIGKVLGAILDVVIKLIPKIMAVFQKLVDGAILIIRNSGPDFIAAGFELLMAFLRGLDQNMDEITNRASSILIKFLNALSENIDPIVTAATNLVINFITALATHTQEFVDAGTDLLVGFLDAMATNVQLITDAVTNLITTLIFSIAGMWDDIATAGTDALVHFLGGLTDDTQKILDAVTLLITTIISNIGGMATQIGDAGAAALVSFLNGIGDNIADVCTAAQGVVIKFAGCLREMFHLIFGGGVEALGKFLGGIGSVIGTVLTKGGEVVGKFVSGIAGSLGNITHKGVEAVRNFRDGIGDTFSEITGKGAGLARALIDGITSGVSRYAHEAIDKVKSLAGDLISGAKGILDSHSPSKEFAKIGGYIVDGLVVGLSNNRRAVNSVTSIGQNMIDAYKNKLSGFEGVADINPTITPVVDLTNVKMGADAINGMFSGPSITPDVSTTGARLISVATTASDEEMAAEAAKGGDITFNQYNTSPKALSEADVYRNTKGQFNKAKEELGIAS